MSTLYTDISPFCCAVLEARVRDGSLPAGDVWCRDVRTLTADEIRRFRHVHLFCGIGGSPLGFMWAGWPDGLSTVSGGFPCQDISSAGKAAGLDGERSGLYRECLRVLDIARPDWTKLENVGALSARGLDRLAGEMDEVGYPIHALRLGAWAVGSAQQRERWWIVSRREDRGADRRGDVLQGDDIAGAGGGLVQSAGARLQGHWADAGESQEPEPWHTGACRRTGRTGWVHPLWVNAQTGEPVPTPRYQGEPPRLFAGTRTISAEWRLGLMGFPYGWLDVPADIAAKYALPACPKKRNKLGIEATGNAQVPQCVAVVAAGMLDAEREAANA